MGLLYGDFIPSSLLCYVSHRVRQLVENGGKQKCIWGSSTGDRHDAISCVANTALSVRSAQLSSAQLSSAQLSSAQHAGLYYATGGLLFPSALQQLKCFAVREARLDGFPVRVGCV